ncbi:MAG: hypothetical protein ACREIP_20185, partial [Alphaproteobacteria bacterium]
PYSCAIKMQLTLLGNRVQAQSDKESFRVHSESTTLFSIDIAGDRAACFGAPAFLTGISAKQIAKTTAKTV